jgi:hypothetical protein
MKNKAIDSYDKIEQFEKQLTTMPEEDLMSILESLHSQAIIRISALELAIERRNDVVMRFAAHEIEWPINCAFCEKNESQEIIKKIRLGKYYKAKRERHSSLTWHAIHLIKQMNHNFLIAEQWRRYIPQGGNKALKALLSKTPAKPLSRKNMQEWHVAIKQEFETECWPQLRQLPEFRNDPCSEGKKRYEALIRVERAMKSRLPV